MKRNIKSHSHTLVFNKNHLIHAKRQRKASGRVHNNIPYRQGENIYIYMSMPQLETRDERVEWKSSPKSSPGSKSLGKRRRIASE